MLGLLRLFYYSENDAESEPDLSICAQILMEYSDDCPIALNPNIWAI